MGAVGDTPARNPVISSWYGAIGVNVDIRVCNGFLYSARSREAGFKAQAAEESLRDLRDRIARDVRTSWLNATNAYERLAVTQQLFEESKLALQLAQVRYNLGLGSIVELSQAQLQQAQAQMATPKPDMMTVLLWLSCNIKRQDSRNNSGFTKIGRIPARSGQCP